MLRDLRQTLVSLFGLTSLKVSGSRDSLEALLRKDPLSHVVSEKRAAMTDLVA